MRRGFELLLDTFDITSGERELVTKICSDAFNAQMALLEGIVVRSLRLERIWRGLEFFSDFGEGQLALNIGEFQPLAGIGSCKPPATAAIDKLHFDRAMDVLKLSISNDRAWQAAVNGLCRISCPEGEKNEWAGSFASILQAIKGTEGKSDERTRRMSILDDGDEG